MKGIKDINGHIGRK